MSPGPPAAPSRVLIVRLDRIGDNVLNSAFLREFRRNHPEAQITLLVRPRVFNLMERCPHVDEVLPFDAPLVLHRPWYYKDVQLLFYARRTLWPRHFDFVVCPRPHAQDSLAFKLAFLSRAARRVGCVDSGSTFEARAARMWGALLSERLRDPAGAHEVTRTLALIRFLGGTVGGESIEVWTDEEDRARAAGWFGGGESGECGPILAVGIGASEPARRWPVEQFVSLLQRMASIRDARFALVGGKEDAGVAARIEEALRGRVVNLAGRTTLRETAAVLEYSSLFVGNNSGPMHMAAAAGCPVVMLRNPSLTSELFAPWQVPFRIVEPDGAGAVGNAREALQGISVDAVVDAVDALVRERGPGGLARRIAARVGRR